MIDKIKQTDASTVAGQKRLKEIEDFLDDLISKIVETYEQTAQSEEQAAITKCLLKELDKPSELFKRINDINIVQFLDGKRSANLQAPEEKTILNDSLILEESAKNCVEDVIENIIKIVENENENSGQSNSKMIGSANNAKLGCIDTNGQVSGEEIIKEMKIVQKIEEIVKKLIKEVLESVDNKCLEFANNKSIEKFEIPMKALDKKSQQNLPKSVQKPLDGIKYCLQYPHILNALLNCSVETNTTTDYLENNCYKQADMFKSYLEQSNKLSEFFQEPNISTDCLQQSNVPSDCLQQPPMSTDSLYQPDLQKANQLTKCLQQEITSTGSLEQTSMSLEYSIQSTSAGSVQHASTSASLQLANALRYHLSQTSTQADSFQQASASTNPLRQESTPADSFIQEIEKSNFLKETIETAYQVFEYQTNINKKTKRAAALIKSINEKARQSNKQGMDNLQEIQNMIDIVNGVGDLNDYLQMDIQKIFLENRELNRMSNYVYEHLITLGHCRSEEFIEEEASDTIKRGLNIFSKIQLVKLQMGKLFRDFFLIQRSFLNQSLKFSSIPYESIIGDNRFTMLLNNVKSSVIGLCGKIFSIEEFDDLYKSTLSDYNNIVRLVEAFTESVVLLDHKPETKRDDEK